MKTNYRILIYSQVAVFLSCSKSNNNNNNNTLPHASNFAVATISTPGNKSVNYNATITGKGTVDQIIYNWNGKDSIVTNPNMPFSIVVPVYGGSMVAMSAIGSTNVGTRTLEYTFTSANGGTVIKNDENCGN